MMNQISNAVGSAAEFRRRTQEKSVRMLTKWKKARLFGTATCKITEAIPRFV
jgi:hypothetical protein